MSKKKDVLAAGDLRTNGRTRIVKESTKIRMGSQLEDEEIEYEWIYHRSRRARRAQARKDGFVWRAMSERDKLCL